MKAMKRFVLAAVLAVAVLPLSAQGPRFDAFYTFGDSLADSGNVFLATQQLGFNPAIPPAKTYFPGRFSNGPNAFDYLWSALTAGTGVLQPIVAAPQLDGTDAVSLAFGGSGTGFVNNSPGDFPVIGLKGQVALFAGALAGHRPSSHALYGIISGANDYIQRDPLSPEEVVANIGQSIQLLYFLRARNIIVVNLPDLGKIPIAFSGLPFVPPSDVLTELSADHNKLLSKTLKQLGKTLPGLNIIAVDLNTVFQGLSTLPFPIEPIVPALSAKRGPAAAVCLFTNPASCPDATEFFSLNPNFVAAFAELPYVFWDAEHPTTAVHGALAAYLLTRVPH
jgi:phospholipase/lecithinase/hemolysin